MIAFLARYLMRRLPDAEIDAEVLRRFPAPPEPTVGEMADALAAHPDFRGFLAWRRTSAEGDEDWGWLASQMDREDVLFQLERAAEQVISSVPSAKRQEGG